MALIDVVGVSKDYSLGKTVIHAIKDISFSINEGDFLSFVGPSGCGKTTILNMLGCIDQPTKGTVLLEGVDVKSLNDDQEAETRLDKIGFIFQSFNLVPVLTVQENVELPMILAKHDIQYRKQRVEKLIEEVGLSEYKYHRPDELSGGQRQRVAIARALVNKPKLVIADEPTANLDSETSASILNLMAALNKEEKTSFVFSTHDPDVVSYANRIIRLKDGRIVS